MSLSVVEYYFFILLKRHAISKFCERNEQIAAIYVPIYQVAWKSCGRISESDFHALVFLNADA